MFFFFVCFEIQYLYFSHILTQMVLQYTLRPAIRKEGFHLSFYPVNFPVRKILHRGRKSFLGVCVSSCVCVCIRLCGFVIFNFWVPIKNIQRNNVFIYGDQNSFWVGILSIFHFSISGGVFGTGKWIDEKSFLWVWRF